MYVLETAMAGGVVLETKLPVSECFSPTGPASSVDGLKPIARQLTEERRKHHVSVMRRRVILLYGTLPRLWCFSRTFHSLPNMIVSGRSFHQTSLDEIRKDFKLTLHSNHAFVTGEESLIFVLLFFYFFLFRLHVLCASHWCFPPSGDFSDFPCY